jgi:hypothetical protein
MAALGGKQTLGQTTVVSMDDPLEIDPRYRKAATRGMWFAAAFTVICAALAALSWAGVMGQRQDAPMLLVMAVGGIVLFIFGRVVIHFFRT